MRTPKYLYTLLFLILSCFAVAQNQSAKIAGIVLDENNKPVEGVNVSYQTKSVTTDVNGFYAITVPARQGNAKFDWGTKTCNELGK